MSTTLHHLPLRRYVRAASSGLATNTQWLGLMAANAAALDEAPWHETPDTAALLPVNDPTQTFAGATAYDAWKQSGDAQSGTGRQCAYAGAAAYRVALPSGVTVQSVSVRLHADKFCVGGLSLVAALSDSSVPLPAWGRAFAGDAREDGCLSVDAASKVSQSANASGAVTLAIETPAERSAPYLYLLLHLTDYESQRREYWIEGSGCIDGASIAVTVEEDVSDGSASLVALPLETVPCVREGHAAVQRAYFDFDDPAPRLFSGADAASVGTRLARAVLSGGAAAGAAAEDAAEPVGFRAAAGVALESDPPDALTCGWISREGPGAYAPDCAHGSALAVFLPDAPLAGRSIGIPVRLSAGAGRVRFVLAEVSSPAVGAIDWADAATLSGSADAVLGVAEATAGTTAAGASIPIRRDAAERFAVLYALPVSLAEYAPGGVRLEPVHVNSLQIQ